MREEKKKGIRPWRLLVSRLLYLIGLSLVLWIPLNGIVQTIQQERSLNQLARELVEQQSKAAEMSRQLEEEHEKAQENHSVLDPFTAADSTVPLYPEAVGFVSIPKIGERLAVFLGASDDHLARGTALITGTDLPFGGKGTHAVLAGHRGWYGNNYFANINHLAQGDLVYLSFLGKERYYVVTGMERIDPDAAHKLKEKEPEQELLTLLTCDPLFYSWQRLLVHTRALSAEEERQLLQGKASFEDLENVPVRWDGQQGQMESVASGMDSGAVSDFLYWFQPYQYRVWWVLLGAGTISWLYTFWQLLRQCLSGAMKGWKKIRERKKRDGHEKISG